MNERDKRQSKRQVWNGAVELYDAEGLLLIGVGRLLDLSEHGSRIEASLRLAPGQILRMRIHLEGQEVINLRATVMRAGDRAHSRSYGIRFDQVIASEWDRLRQSLYVLPEAA